MSFNQSTGNVNISGNVTALPALTVPSATQTLKTAIATGTGAAQTIATVTGGKTAYVTSFTVAGVAAGAAYLRDNGDALLVGVTVAINGTATIAPNSPIAVYTTGQNIRCSGVATQTISITYFEQ